MFSSLDVSTSGLVAQRARLNAISTNIANMSTTRNELGEAEPFRPRYVTFQTDNEIKTPGGGAGVKIGSVEYSAAPPNEKYEPGHPDADERGFVSYPGISPVSEMMNLLTAVRIYEANVAALGAAKAMAQRTLELGG
jgi:flagellar basal-body rod protein FlgC